MRPLVSVVVPTHNRARLLERTLRSIVAQEVQDLEILVVDDGSTDAGAVAAACGTDPRVRVLRSGEAAGVSVARNRGIASARGEWIAFCDDDDLWAPDKLTRQLDAAERAAATWVYAGDVNVDERLTVLSGGPPVDPGAVLAIMPRWNPIASGGSNVLVRSTTLTEVGGFDEALRRTEDWDLWIRLARAGPPACVRAPLVAYRFHPGNVAVDPYEMIVEAREIARRYDAPVDMAAMHRRAAWASLRGGRRLAAVRQYARAVTHGDVWSIARAAVAAGHPGVGTDRLFRLLPRDPAWTAEAERWLARFAAVHDKAAPAP